MPIDVQDRSSLRLAELIAALSLATDLGLGQPMEYLLHTCLLAVGLGRSLGMSDADLHDVYYVALLRWIGCTGHAHEASRLFGDEISARARLAVLDSGRPAVMLLEGLRHIGEGRPLPMRLSILAGALAAGPRKETESQFRASCEVAQLLAERFGFGDGVKRALWHAFERWDGKGVPNGAKGDAIPAAMRVVVLAQDVEVFYRDGGVDAAMSVVRGRAGSAYDPVVAAAFYQQGEALLRDAGDGQTWARVMAAEPAPQALIPPDGLDAALEVVADYVDLKSPYMAGHSRGVSALAADAAHRCGLSDVSVTDLRCAGLLHDLGRTGIPNSIWDKPGKLTDGEWERVRLHPYLTGRIMLRPALLARLAEVASSHHERLDGTGFHRAVTAPMLSLPARILAAADTYQAMIEPRAYRPALTPEVAAAELRSLAGAGCLDGQGVDAVLGAAGHTVRRRRQWPAGLSSREVEVLRLLVRGLPNREIARVLFISERTAAHHIQHIYGKIGVSKRGAAALFAMQHDLLQQGAETETSHCEPSLPTEG